MKNDPPEMCSSERIRLLRANRALRAVARAADAAETPQELLDSACAALKDHLGYRHTCAVFTNRHFAPRTVAEHDADSPFPALLAEWRQNGLPTCVRSVLTATEPVCMGEVTDACTDCAACAYGNDLWAAPLHFREQARGLLAVIDHGQGGNEAERALLMDAAADIAAGLHRLEQRDARHEAERRFQALVDNLMGMVYQCRLDPDWTMEYLSGGALELTGYRPEQLLGNAERTYADLIHPEDRGRVQDEIREAVAAERPFVLRYRIVRADGQERWMVERGHVVPNGSPANTRLEGLITDVTDQVAREEELRKSEAQFRHVFEDSAVAKSLTLPDGRLGEVNSRLCDLLGYTREELLALTITDITHPDDLERTRAKAREALEGRCARYRIENRYRCKDGSEIWADVSTALLRGEQGEPVHFITAINDITDRKVTEEALRNSEARFRLLIENAPEPIFVQLSGCFSYLNRAACALFGAESPDDLTGTPVLERFHPDYRDIVRERIRRLNELSEAAPMLEERILRLDGEAVLVEVTAVPVAFEGKQGALVFMHDLTLRKQVEERQRKLEVQLQQAQKMESVGRLAGGVAHDFNNLLMPIIGHAEFLAIDQSPDDPAWEHTQEILAAAERARGVASQLLAFSREKQLAMESADLNRIVQAFRKMLGNLLGENVALLLHLAPESLVIKGDVGQLEQVLMNLAVNARDAMPDGGQLRIETSAVTIDDEYIEERPSVLPGPYALLTVTDEGVGMDEATRNQIFDPFFTTKANDKGTGLGLSTVYGIVKQHGGHVWVYSEPGHGTTFKVYLPLVEVDTPTVPATHDEPARPGAPTEPSQPRCVLVLEDLAPVRKLVVQMLTRMGHGVMEAETVAEAQALANEVDEIHLMVSDVILPDGKGPDCCERIRERHQDMRVIYMSGYTESVVIEKHAQAGMFLQKPFTAKTLAATVERALSADDPSAAP